MFISVKKRNYKVPTSRETLITFLILFFSLASFAENFDEPYSQNVYGGIGLIQTPTARFSHDGELLFGYSTEAPYNRLYSKMQFFPWMEAVLRYTEGTHMPYNPGMSQTSKDKGIDLKFKLFEDQKNNFSLALGLIDVGGTGTYSSEYVVASKKTNNFDFSIGLGWGRLGGLDHLNNFVATFSPERKRRGGNILTLDGEYFYGGEFNIANFFSGEQISVFGGVEYFTPIENLSLKLEYDTSGYIDALGKKIKLFEESEIFEVNSRVNYALNYRLFMSDRERLDLSLGLVRGNTLYANIAVHSNLNFSGLPSTIMGAERIRNTNLQGGLPFSELDSNRQQFLFNRTIKEMAYVGFVTHSITYKSDEIIAEVSQNRFLDTDNAIDLASRVLANNSPKNIKKITVINLDSGIETIRSTVPRRDLVKSVSKGPLNQDLIEYNLYSQEESYEDITIKNDFLYPNFYWEIKPRLNHTLQHQQRFFFWQVEANIQTVLSIIKGMYFKTEYGLNIDNNFDKYTYHVPDGELYHVRQDRRLFLTEGESGLRRMVLDYLVDLSPNLKAKVHAGYLEMMFGGIGGEILYLPDNRNWALGFDAHWVKQRDFDQGFSFQDYETVTGFLSYYQQIPFYDLRLKLSAGKFLGKDVGALVDISRRFSNGSRVGGFAALTDCDPQCVGEGSFHKGIYFELPMDYFYVQSTTRNKNGYSWSPLTKDAGARLDIGGLYELVTDASDEVDHLRQKNWSVKKIFNGFGTKPREKL